MTDDQAAAFCPPDGAAAVSLEDVDFSYGEEAVLRGVNLEVPAGSFTAVIGPNGAGKSTLLRLVLGLLRPERGSVRVFGHPPEGRHRPIGYVPQRVTLPKGFPLSALEVVLMGRYRSLGVGRRPRRRDRRKALEALELVGLGGQAHRRFQDLSGGQQQRALIARALVGEPCLLVLDEPTAGLDPAARARFYGLVCDLQRARGLTLLCASHDVEDVADHAQSLVLLNRGVQAQGPPAEVLAGDAIREVYHFPRPHEHPRATGPDRR